jgi:crotonobetainyl-CoA:carnitine CoA-transferase CaiB-like acyl-CoA transferase
VRVIAVEQFGAGPFATLFLADLGADVIKIEDPSTGGDVARHVPPGQQDNGSLYFEAFNRGKRSIALDLKNGAGRRVLERLVAVSQVVFNNLRGDAPDHLGLTYASLQHVNPAIICASLSAYGRAGERRSYPGYDPLVQAEAGWASLTGEPEGPPVKSGLSLADYAAGLTSALAILAAVFDAQRTGRGREVDVALYDVALAQLSYLATWYLTLGIVPERQPLSAHPSIVPFQFFETADGYIAVACAKEKFFRDLALLMDLPELAADPRFASFDARRAHRDELLVLLSRRFREESTERWMERLGGRVPCAPVRTVPQALDEDELRSRNMLAGYESALFGTVRSLGLPVSISDFRPTYRPAPSLDGDRGAILADAGFEPDEVAELREAGAFGLSGDGVGEPPDH